MAANQIINNLENVETQMEAQSSVPTRRERRKREFTLKTRNNEKIINTILFRLTKEKETELKKIADLDLVLSQAYKFKITGAKLSNDKLFIFPKTESEYDTIVGDKIETLLFNVSRTGLANKSVSVIIRNISIRDINAHKGIQRELESMGIIEISPLIADQDTHLAVKGRCNTRQEHHELMCKFFVEGKQFTLINGKTVWVNFDPDIPKVIQCFHCLKLGHFANDCVNPIRCEICGKEGHGHEKCQTPTEPKCANCREQHEATDPRCELLADAKRAKTKETLYHITGKFLERPQRFGKNRAENYREALKKNADKQNTIDNTNVWLQMASDKVNALEQQAEYLNNKHETDIQAKCLNLDNIADKIKEAADSAKATNDNIAKLMADIANRAAEQMANYLDGKIGKEIVRVEGRLDEHIGNSKNNQIETNERLNALEQWALLLSNTTNVSKLNLPTHKSTPNNSNSSSQSNSNRHN